MSYRPKHDYRKKDALERGDPLKRVMGFELSDEFEAISASISNLDAGTASVNWNDVTGKPSSIYELGVNNKIFGGVYTAKRKV